MLYPQSSSSRAMISLDGFWKFAPDVNDDGEQRGWPLQLPADREIGVPASWNEQFQDLMYFFGTGWYEREVELSRQLRSERIWLRVGSANYLSTVWVNGTEVGRHEGAHLPFVFEITDHVRWDGPNRITIRVDAAIAADRLPPGDVEDEQIVGFKGQYPNNYYDFFPYGGIHRSVTLFTTPLSFVSDIQITTGIDGTDGKVKAHVGLSEGFEGACTVSIRGTQCRSSVEIGADGAKAVFDFTVPAARLWCPEDPFLYELEVRLTDGDGQVIDQYVQTFGIRTVSIRGTELLLNGKPVFLTGFGMHEDFPVLGKGISPAVIAKDFNLLNWIGANSVRTSHYPYSDEFLSYADKHGLLVIGETPFVGFVRSHYQGTAILNKAKRVITEMIERDVNHPCVIAWSLANEGDTLAPEADAFYEALYSHAKSLDDTRPITIVNCVDVEKDVALKHYDFVSLNRYHGWYEQAGRLDEGCRILSEKLDRCYEVLGKPVIVTEFGADAVAGVHVDPPEVFSEEYQAEMVTRQYEIIRQKPYTIGAHVWSFADFKTSQTPSRVVVNRKGVFTRDRQPKLSAHKLKALWGRGSSKKPSRT
ncbi:beta-glucuronidase [Paenibacillus tyrfis]|uniref:beta-glucuronidase n=1 Tax=Paenibacillus tyrfis TaxID=1501230 RepID=UPI00068E2103|nr:beta-glucuronidase [Paenibacillus tyrfis]